MLGTKVLALDSLEPHLYSYQTNSSGPPLSALGSSTHHIHTHSQLRCVFVFPFRAIKIQFGDKVTIVFLTNVALERMSTDFEWLSKHTRHLSLTSIEQAAATTSMAFNSNGKGNTFSNTSYIFPMIVKTGPDRQVELGTDLSSDPEDPHDRPCQEPVKKPENRPKIEKKWTKPAV